MNVSRAERLLILLKEGDHRISQPYALPTHRSGSDQPFANTTSCALPIYAELDRSSCWQPGLNSRLFEGIAARSVYRQPLQPELRPWLRRLPPVSERYQAAVGELRIMKWTISSDNVPRLSSMLTVPHQRLYRWFYLFSPVSSDGKMGCIARVVREEWFDKRVVPLLFRAWRSASRWKVFRLLSMNRCRKMVLQPRVVRDLNAFKQEVQVMWSFLTVYGRAGGWWQGLHHDLFGND